MRMALVFETALPALNLRCTSSQSLNAGK